jgi:hypothetical protein
VALGNWNSVLFAIINSQFQVLPSFDCLVTELASTFSVPQSRNVIAGSSQSPPVRLFIAHANSAIAIDA